MLGSLNQLARLILLAAGWLFADALAAQNRDDPLQFQLRRLPPVDAAFSQPPREPLRRDALGLVSHQSPHSPPVDVGLGTGTADFGNGLALEALPPPYPDAPVAGPAVAPEFAEPVSLDEQVELACPVSDLPYQPFGRPYNYIGSGAPNLNGWIVGNGDRMGIFSLALNYRDWWCVGRNRTQLNLAVHSVSGPVQTDMPAELYDLDIGFVRRDTIISSALAYEVALRAGFFSDFVGSARDGLRFPGHAILFYQVSETRQYVFGVDFLHRDDVPVLPVLGAAFRPHPKLWLEAVFPKPRIAVQIGSHRWWYVAAEMGGGQWAIERVWRENDVVTYRDFRVLLGVQQDHIEGYLAFLELGFVFDRQLEYRSGVGDYQPRDTGFVRAVIRY